MNNHISATANPSRRRSLRRLTMGVVCGCAACTFGSGPNHSDVNAPMPGAIRNRLNTPRPLALVLSSGGPRGFVHVGVIEALDEIGVRPDMLIGASIGALLSVLYCGGLSGKQLREIALDLGPTQFASLAIGAKERFSGAPIANRVNKTIGNRPLQDLSPVCGVVVLSRSTGKPVVFTRGNAGVAVQASTAIEGQFTPVTIRSEVFADADKVSPLPVRLARQLGAARVLSVDASAHEDRAPANAGKYRASDRRKRDLTRPDANSADLNLHPDFGYWVSLSQAFRERAMRAGYEETMRVAEKILTLSK